MIAGRLTHRARVERNTATGTDAFGGPVAPVFTVLHASLKCFVFSKTSRELTDGAKTAMIEDLRVLLPLNVDLAEGDEFVSVTDALGNAVIAGRLKVEGPVQFKHNHREAALQRIG
jgi:hypothetical protein